MIDTRSSDNTLIDMRALLRDAYQRWWLVLLVAIIFVVLGVVYTLTRTIVYESQAVVAIVDPRYDIELDRQIAASGDLRLDDAIADIAVSGDVMNTTLTLLGDDNAASCLPPDITVQRLRSRLDVNAPQRSGLVELLAQNADPDCAAAIANAWATAMVSIVNEVYQPVNQDLTVFEAELEDALEDIAAADAALEAFQAESDLNLLQARVTNMTSTYLGYLDTAAQLESAAQNVDTLRQLLLTQPASDDVNLSSDILLLAVQLQTLEVTASTGTLVSSSPPQIDGNQESPVGLNPLMTQQQLQRGDLVNLEVQLTDGATISDLTASEQLDYLDTLDTIVVERLAALDAIIEAYPEEIRAVQQTYQAEQNEYDRLLEQKRLAEDVYEAVSRQLVELNIQAASESGVVAVASTAYASGQPASIDAPLVIAGAAVLGVIAGILLVVAIAYLRLVMAP